MSLLSLLAGLFLASVLLTFTLSTNLIELGVMSTSSVEPTTTSSSFVMKQADVGSYDAIFKTFSDNQDRYVIFKADW